MWNVFKGTLSVLVRNREIFIWSLAFPIILSTMFMFMFSGLDDASSFKPVPTAVIVDDNYKDDVTFSNMIDSLGATGESQLLAIHEYASADEANEALIAGDVSGILSVTANGDPRLQVKAASDGIGVAQVNRSILNTVVDTYVRNKELLSTIAAENPLALADPAAIEEALDRGDATTEVSLTHTTPNQSVRYYYALLGMTTLFCAQIGVVAICKTQPNLSALGARRALGATSRGKTLTATLLASWLVAFLCLLVAFVYIRFAIGVDFGGREGICIAALALTALFTTSLGTLLGALPKINMNVKSGLLTGLTCTFSLFAGLYGEPCMALADKVAREMPALAAVNPAKVVADTFYSLCYYDSLIPFFEKVGILLLMTALLFAVSALFVRRQRYASL